MVNVTHMHMYIYLVYEYESLVQGIEVARGGPVGAGYGTLIAATAGVRGER